MVARRYPLVVFVFRSSLKSFYISLVRWKVKDSEWLQLVGPARPEKLVPCRQQRLSQLRSRSRSRSCLSSQPHVTSGGCAQNASTAQEDADRVPAMQTAKDKGTYLIHLCPSDHHPSLRASNDHYEVVRVLFRFKCFHFLYH